VSAKPTWIRVAAHALPFLALSACSWFTDFKQQPKIDPWETAADSIPFRGNPQGSVPTVGSVAPGFQYDRLPVPGSITAMAGIANPVPADSASVNRGRLNFQINCAVCHGPGGMGNGTVAKYGMPGPSIGAGSNAANSLTDGYIFGMIRNGRGLMPPYNRIEEPDRWDIVNYLRTLQGKGTIAADTTHGFPGQNGATVPSATHFGPTRPSPYYHPGTTRAASTPVSVGGMQPLPAVPPAAGQDSTKKPPTDSTKKPEQSL
jgi:mono/diheme cytochrome c family protein